MVGEVIEPGVRVGATGRRHHVRWNASEPGRLFAGCRARVHGGAPPRQADEAHRPRTQPADEALDARRPRPVLGCRQPTRARRRALDEIGHSHPVVQERVDGILVQPTSLSRSHRAPLAKLALKHRLPSMFGGREYVEAGGLMSYAPDYVDLTRRAATYIDKILKGAKPADLPVELASKYLLVINFTTAKALKLDLPWFLEQRADEVIE